jgi:nucleotide-binding universal stress UspA family protein
MLARAMGSETHLLAICRDLVSASLPEMIDSALIECEAHAARTILDEGIRRLFSLGINAHGKLLIGDPRVHIPTVAAEIGADLIVIGHRPRGHFARWWSDSPHPALIHRVSCSILVAMNADEQPAG